MTDKQFEQIECISQKLWEDINNGHEYSMVTYSEFLGIVTEVWESLQEEPNKVKFNVGDTIKNKDGYEVTIESVGDDCYFVNKAQACIKFSTQDQWELVEEPVGEDLEEAAENYGARQGAELKPFAIKYFKAGAKWQKEKEYTCYEEAFEDGSKWQKEKMIAKAIETTFNVSLPSGLYDKLWIKGCKEGNKLLVIKKDEL